MSTGIIGTLSGMGTITYTPVNAAKVKITFNGSGGCSVNGAPIIPGSTAPGNSVEIFLGAGQTLDVSMNSSQGSTGAVIVSALES